MNAKSPAFIHQSHEDGIQEFVLTEVSRRAVDDLFDFTEGVLSDVIAQDANSDVGQPVLIDSSVGLQSLNYTFIRMRSLVNKFPARKQGRVALLLPSNPLIKTVAMIMRPLAPVRIYGSDEREAALKWLREAPVKS